jgi:hypothetical protein
MGVRMVGSSETADLRVEPISFEHCIDVAAHVPAGAAEIEERLMVARFRCQHGGPKHTGQDCLACGHYRGWKDGPGFDSITIRCGFSDRDPVTVRMTCAPALVTVAPETMWREAEARAAEANVHHLLVMSGERLVGVTCACEVGRHPPDEPVRAALGPTVFAVEVDATLGEAAAAMVRLGLGCLPVLDHGALVGVITSSDLRGKHSELADEILDDAHQYGGGD